jgi:hypothetical protein
VTLAAGRTIFQLGGVAVSGTGVTPNAAYLFITVFGS